ncbi:MAG TPA: RdgB/HAM1 family non-canonical purine NTP pyrophosphatase [Rhizomicrobium sp.]|jgi:XTP/dITP diphosphohydrolase
MRPLVIATHNPGKLVEMRVLLEPFGFNLRSAGELGLPEPDETGGSFAENAALKARAAADASGMLALADDSGLAVAALDGAPGIYSARWASESKDFAAAMERIEQLLTQKGATDMSAKFVSALALAEPHGKMEIFIGEAPGHLEFPARGDKGFGYDPIFVMDGETETFGELDNEYKHAISHRARAFAKLTERLKAAQ